MSRLLHRWARELMLNPSFSGEFSALLVVFGLVSGLPGLAHEESLGCEGVDWRGLGRIGAE